MTQYKKKMYHAVIICVLMITLAGCNSGSSGGTPGAGGTVDIPDGATLISNEEYNDLIAQGKLEEISDDDQREQADAFESQYKEDTRTIDDFITDTGARDPRPGEPNDDQDSVNILPDGNVRHTITMKDGRTRDVITMGRKQSIHSIAQGIRVYPTRDNQLGMYRRLFELIPSDIKRELELVDPDAVAAHPEEYDVEYIQNKNNFITGLHEAIINSIGDLTVVPVEPYDCGNDMGAGEGSDRVGCDDSICGFDNTGIFMNFTWNHKEDLSCVKDQAGRGSCCAFAVVSATEYWVKRKLEYRVNLSEQALYNRMKLNWVRDDDNDGYYISDALDNAIIEGYLIPFEQQWNYNPSLNRVEFDGGGFSHSCDNYTDTCSNSSHQSDIVCNGSGDCSYYVPEKNPNYYGFRLKKGHVIWDWHDRDMSFCRVLIYLALGDPVLIQVPVLDQFDEAHETGNGYITYVAGDVDNPATGEKSTNRGNHIMHAVSLIDNARLNEILPDAPEGAGGGYVIVKNSWSNCWGDGGYVYIPYSYIQEYTQYASVLTAIYEE